MTESPAQPIRPEKAPLGFSFFGIAMALVGISTVAAIAIPLWFRRPAITLNGAAKLLVQDILQVQEHAIILRVGSRIEFDSDGGGYQAMDATGLALPAPMGNGPYLRDYDQDAVFEGVLVQEVDFGGSQRLEFDRNGYSLNDGYVLLTFRNKSLRIVFDANEAYIQNEKER